MESRYSNDFLRREMGDFITDQMNRLGNHLTDLIKDLHKQNDRLSGQMSVMNERFKDLDEFIDQHMREAVDKKESKVDLDMYKKVAEKTKKRLKDSVEKMLSRRDEEADAYDRQYRERMLGQFSDKHLDSWRDN